MGNRPDFWPMGHSLLIADQEHKKKKMKNGTFIVVFIQVPYNTGTHPKKGDCFSQLWQAGKDLKIKKELWGPE